MAQVQYKSLDKFNKFQLFVEPTRKVLTNIVVTFVQAGAATWLATGFATDKIAIGGAIGAGLSAVWNLVIKPFLIQKGWLTK